MLTANMSKIKNCVCVFLNGASYAFINMSKYIMLQMSIVCYNTFLKLYSYRKVITL